MTNLEYIQQLDKDKGLKYLRYVCPRLPYYFAFPLVGYKRRGHDGYGVFVNFFGEGVAFFSPTETGAERFYETVSKYKEGGNGCK